MYFRDSFPSVRFARSPQPKRIQQTTRACSQSTANICSQSLCCTCINLKQMSYLHMFRRKPAITRLDWHFTTFQNSSENYATFTRSIHYNLVLERSSSFGSNRNNLPNTLIMSKPYNYNVHLSPSYLSLRVYLRCDIALLYQGIQLVQSLSLRLQTLLFLLTC